MVRMIRRGLALGAVGWVMLLTSVALVAQPVAQMCSDQVRLALQTAGDVCEGTARNQVCYGHVAGSVTARDASTAVEWDSVGDRVGLADISGVALSPMDEQTGEWGVAVMQVQANLPDTLPGQNVTVLMFGDVALTDAATDQTRVEGMVLAAANVRLSPSTNGVVIGSLPASATAIVTGQTVNGTGEAWLRVKYDDYRTRTGWVAADLIAVDVAALPVVEADSLVYNPMQAFYLKTGLGATQCGEVPTNGVVIQTPSGIGKVNLNVNGANISLGSTAFLTTDTRDDGASALSVTLFEGEGVVEAGGVAQILVPGSQTSLPLSAQTVPLLGSDTVTAFAEPIGLVASAPSRPVAYDPAAFGAYAEALSAQGVELPPPATQGQIEQRNPRRDREDLPQAEAPVCIDRNADSECDTCPDRNQNGQCDALECFDTDGDGDCDRGCGDRNQNGVCDYQECLDADGDGRCDERCFDVNENGVCDGQEGGEPTPCPDRNNDGTCDNQQCVDTDGDGRCDCADINQNGVCDRAECSDFPDLPACVDNGTEDDDGVCNELIEGGTCEEEDTIPDVCAQNDPRPICNGCQDRNNDGICDRNQCLDTNGDGRCDCLDVNKNGICDSDENS